MRFGVIGAGAVGGLMAALLDRAGHDVEVTARGEQLAAIRSGGIRLDGGFGEHTARVTAGEVLTQRPDIAFLTTKAQDAREALAPHVELLDGLPLVVVQNGIGGLDVAHELLPDSPLIGALALFAVSYLEPGRVTVTAALPTIVGAGPGCTPGRLADVVAAIGDAVPLEVTDDIEGAQWTKLLINHVNALPAITGLSVQQTIDDRRLRKIITASMRETSRIAAAAGIRFADVQGTPGDFAGRIARLPLAIAERIPLAIRRRIGEVPNPGSTLQSIRRGRLTEIDYLNGAVVRVAAERGLTAPINAALVELVHEVEESGRFFTPAEVVARVPVR
jgi:2-dehydropantoate 2-reductase